MTAHYIIAGPADAIATDAVEEIDICCRPYRAVVIVFDPHPPPEEAALYCNASAESLIPVLRAVLERLESGALRMPVSADEVRWVDEGKQQ
jgi:hypothetical protein